MSHVLRTRCPSSWASSCGLSQLWRKGNRLWSSWVSSSMWREQTFSASSSQMSCSPESSSCVLYSSEEQQQAEAQNVDRRMCSPEHPPKCPPVIYIRCLWLTVPSERPPSEHPPPLTYILVRIISQPEAENGRSKEEDAREEDEEKDRNLSFFDISVAHLNTQ